MAQAARAEGNLEYFSGDAKVQIKSTKQTSRSPLERSSPVFHFRKGYNNSDYLRVTAAIYVSLHSMQDFKLTRPPGRHSRHAKTRIFLSVGCITQHDWTQLSQNSKMHRRTRSYCSISNSTERD